MSWPDALFGSVAALCVTMLILSLLAYRVGSRFVEAFREAGEDVKRHK
jgi:hypothetical protein